MNSALPLPSKRKRSAVRHGFNSGSWGARLTNYACVVILFIAGVQLLWSTIGNNLDSQDTHNLAAHISSLRDPDHRHTIESVLTPKVAATFQKNHAQTINFGFSSDVIWLRIDIPHLTQAPQKTWLMELGRSYISQIEVYRVFPDGHHTQLAPEHAQRVDEYRLRYVNPTYVITTQQGETQTLIVKMKSESSLYMPVTLWDPEHFNSTINIAQFFYGVFFGGMIVMLAFNFFVWLVVQDNTYLYYCGHLLGAIAFQFIDIGRGIPMLGHYAEYLNKGQIAAIVWFTWFCSLLFIRAFLELKSRHPLIDRFTIGLLYVVCIGCGISFVFQTDLNQLHVVFFSSCMLMLFPVLGVYSYLKGNQNAFYFTLAWCFNVTGYFVYTLVTMGILPANGASHTAAPAGGLLEVILLSLALANRIKLLQQTTLRARQRGLANLLRFQSVFKNATEGIYQMSLDGEVRTANPAMIQLMGFTSEADLKAHSRVVRKALFPAVDQQFAKLAINSRLTEERNIDVQGHSILILHRLQLIRDAHGHPSHLEGTCADISDRRDRERAEKERTLERFEKDLAKGASDEKTEFLKRMGFEIRTPLSAIIGFGELLKSPRIPADEKKDLNHNLLYNSQQLLNLINDILDYSKIEAGKMGIEQLKTDLFMLVEKIQSNVEFMAKRRKLGFELEYQYPLPREVSTDPTRLRQILENICQFALDSTPSGTVKMILRWDNDSNRLHFSLKDNGAGLSEAEQGKLFDAFRGTTSRYRIAGGSGLGLPIAKRLAKLIDGELSFQSKFGQGTRFDLMFDCQPPERALWVTSRAPALVSKTKAKASVPQLVGTILLAEDNLVNQQLIQRIIRKTGATVVIVGDGAKAVECATKQTFDLILMDVNMPVMDGLEATGRIREHGFLGAIYALTAEQGQQELDACLLAGCNGYLSKPIEMEKFYSTLAQYLQETESEASHSA